MKYVLKFLQRGPMSIADLEESFASLGKKFERSDKSIYRYLKELINRKLVVKGGKRVRKDADEMKTETIFMRTAIAFITVTPIDDRDCKGDELCPVWEGVRLLLEEQHNKKIDAKKFAAFANKLDQKMDDLVKRATEKGRELMRAKGLGEARQVDIVTLIGYAAEEGFEAADETINFKIDDFEFNQIWGKRKPWGKRKSDEVVYAIVFDGYKAE